MLKDKLNSIIQKQITASTEFWAGKPKLTKEELSAVESFAKRKGNALDEFFSVEENKNAIHDLFMKSTRK
jgi:hypothetical protein